MAPLRATLQALTSKDAGNLSPRLLELIQAMIRGEDFRRIFEAFGSYIVAHPEQVAGLLIGIILRANPLAFGVLGPVPGSLASGAWQASIRDVAARNLVTFLQSAGMLNAVAIPLAYGLTAGAAAAAAALTATPLATRLRAKF